MRIIRHLTMLVAFCGLLSLSLANEKTRELKIYNWSSYVDQALMDDFTAKTGIKVITDAVDSNEALLAKTLTGNSGYDIIVPSDFAVTYLMEADQLLKLDFNKMPNYHNLLPFALERLATFEGINDYAIPYFWGTTGIGYDAQKIHALLPEAPVDSYALVFDPKYAAKIAECGIYLLDSAVEMTPLINIYLGQDPESVDPQDLANVQKVLEDIRPYIKKFHSSEYISAIANGDACVAVGWSGDFFMAKESADDAGRSHDIQYSVPKEGSILWFDELVILKNAKNIDEAYEFINYMLDAKNSAKASNKTMAPTPNLAAFEYLDPKLKNNTMLFPPEESLKSVHIKRPYDLSGQKKLTRMWMRIKSGK
ncbi:extracellular solute-binding protein [Ignatzschineria rhizosphaerae]|uniref:Putrescine-binding periplasmic protein n=1 Tax=Ignatzschineria rhizosphaerae TaxID=2923279 RepID=A0ABY3WXP8_9GAMM|nr:extracellular solute-binding protein [Ignatzschineria rhizosphaerae]UNM95384.1 extracellular solute-binding protein [Ignatzschineria rhizosphaerae]